MNELQIFMLLDFRFYPEKIALIFHLQPFKFGMLFFAFFLFSPASAFSIADVERFDSLKQKIEENAFAHGEQAKELVAELQIMADNHPENIAFAIQSLYLEAMINNIQGINDTSLLRRCRNVFENKDFSLTPFDVALSNYTLALCHTAGGNYAKAFSLALQSLEQFRNLNDTAFIIRALTLSEDICKKTNSKKMAEDFGEEALALTTPDEKEYYKIFIGLHSNVNPAEENTETAIDSLMALIPKLKQHDMKELLPYICLNIGALFHQEGDIQKAEHYYHISREYIDSISFENHKILFLLYYNSGVLSIANHNLNTALQYAYKAYAIAVKNNNLEQLSHSLRLLSQVYNDLGPMDSAYHYVYRYGVTQNMFNANSRIMEAYQEYSAVLLESAQKELIIAQQEITLKNRRFIIAILSIIGMTLLASLLLFIIQQKRRTMAKRIEQDEKIRQLQEEKIEAQLRELSSNALLLSGKNAVLQQINDIMKNLPDHHEEMEEVKKIIKSNLATDQAKKSFMIHFNQVHPGFFEKLKLYAPALTENNLRLCAYLRIGMSPKQIAQILNMSPENIRKSSYRLKLKLRLGEEDNLYDFLRKV